MSNIETTKIDMRTREGRALASEGASIRSGLSATPASSEPVAEASSAPSELVSPAGRRITRENRRGFGNQGQKLAYPDRDGYHRHWFNDTPGRVAAAQESGYTSVIDPATKQPVTRVVGVSPIGGPLHAYLLEIPQEWYDDDMAELEKINASKEEALKRGPQAANPSDVQAFYPTAQGRQSSIRRK